MKARKIFRKAAAGLMSLSLLMSGLPVTAAEVNHAASNQQTEAAGETGGAEAAGMQQAPEQSSSEGNPALPIDSDGSQDVNNAGTDSSQTPGQNLSGETEGRQNPDSGQNGESQNPSGEAEGQQNPSDSQAEGSGEGQNPVNSQTEGEGDAQTPGQNSSDSQTEGSGDTQNPSDSQAEGNEEQQNSEGGTAGEDADFGNSDNKEASETDSEKGGSESDKKDDETSEEGVRKDDPAAAAARSTVSGSIAVDGSLSDWAGVAKRSGSGVNYWKAALSPDGNTLYFSFAGTASTEWDYNFTKNNFQFTYPDGASDISSAVSIFAGQGGAEVKNAYFGDVPGAEAAVINEAHGNNPGPYAVEFAVPVSFFHSTDFLLTFGGTTIASDEIEQVNGDSIAEDLPAVYAGISIDGNYEDWKAVAKTEASCPNSAHTGCLSQVAAVFDGDWFYIYVKDGKDSNASGAGTHSNGKYAITSDLGYETDIQLSTAPEVSGVNEALVSYVGSEWEIAIPKDQLPKYRESLSFGLYQGEPFIGGIVNLQPDSGNNLENLFEGINFDGQYEDWEDYGHSTIQYATAGSQESQIDAKGALYSSDGKLFGHVVTNMPQHLQEAGQEFTEAITIAFNQSAESLKSGSVNQGMVFYPRFVTVDASGAINWNPSRAGLPEGTYEYHIVSRDAWGTSGNISNLQEMDQIYGKMMMTIGKGGKDEMEFYLELPLIAKKLGVDATDLKEIAAQFGRLGQEWIFTAGTSTGPLAGVAVSVASVGIVFWYRKRKKNELLPAAG